MGAGEVGICFESGAVSGALAAQKILHRLLWGEPDRLEGQEREMGARKQGKVISGDCNDRDMDRKYCANLAFTHNNTTGCQYCSRRMLQAYGEIYLSVEQQADTVRRAMRCHQHTYRVVLEYDSAKSNDVFG